MYDEEIRNKFFVYIAFWQINMLIMSFYDKIQLTLLKDLYRTLMEFQCSFQPQRYDPLGIILCYSKISLGNLYYLLDVLCQLYLLKHTKKTF